MTETSDTHALGLCRLHPQPGVARTRHTRNRCRFGRRDRAFAGIRCPRAPVRRADPPAVSGRPSKRSLSVPSVRSVPWFEHPECACKLTLLPQLHAQRALRRWPAMMIARMKWARHGTKGLTRPSPKCSAVGHSFGTTSAFGVRFGSWFQPSAHVVHVCCHNEQGFGGEF